MSIKTYNKLVRDRIPEIIKADGEICTMDVSTLYGIFNMKLKVSGYWKRCNFRY